MASEYVQKEIDRMKNLQRGVPDPNAVGTSVEDKPLPKGEYGHKTAAEIRDAKKAEAAKAANKTPEIKTSSYSPSSSSASMSMDIPSNGVKHSSSSYDPVLNNDLLRGLRYQHRLYQENSQENPYARYLSSSPGSLEKYNLTIDGPYDQNNALTAPYQYRNDFSNTTNYDEQYANMSPEQQKELTATMAKMQQDLKLTQDYGSDLGGKFGELLTELNRSQQIYSEKLNELAQMGFSNKAAGFSQGQTSAPGAAIPMNQVGASAGDEEALGRAEEARQMEAAMGHSGKTGAQTTQYETNVEPVISAEASIQNPSAASAAQLATDFLKSFGTTTTGAKYEGAANHYDMISRDLQELMMAGLAQQDKTFQDFMTTNERHNQLMIAEYDATRARIESSATRSLNAAQEVKDNALKANELAMDKDLSRRDESIDLMRDNLSRYQGFLQAKLEAAGMTAGSEGLNLIGKYMASADMQLRYAQDDRSDAQAAYLARSKEITDDYFARVFEIEESANTKLESLFFDMQKGMLESEQNVLQAIDTKQKNTIASLSEFTSKQLEIEKTKQADIYQQQQLSLQQAQYEHGVLMDSIRNEQWDKTYGLDIDKFNFDKEKYGEERAMALQAQAFNQMMAQKNYDLNANQFYSNESAKKLDVLTNMWKEGGISTEQYNQLGSQLAPEIFGTMLDQTRDIANIMYGDQTIADRVMMTEQNAAMQRATKGDGYQCVQYVRDIVPDLPTNLYTLEDKEDILLNSPNAIGAPVAGAVAVMDMSGKDQQNLPASSRSGHVSFVTSVNPESGTFTVTEFNVKPGRQSTETYSMDDPRVKGFWLSPKMGYGVQDVGGIGDKISSTTQALSGLFGQLTGWGDQYQAGQNLSEGIAGMTQQPGQTVVPLTEGITTLPSFTSYGLQTSLGGYGQTPTSYTDLVDDNDQPQLRLIEETYGSAAADFTNTFYNITENMGSVSATNSARLRFLQNLANGDEAALQESFITQAFERMPESTKNAYYTNASALAAIDNAIADVTGGPNTNLYKSFTQGNIVPLLGQAQDQEWRNVIASVQAAIIPIRKEYLGAAQTEPEIALTKEIFPDPKTATPQDLLTSLSILRRNMVDEKRSWLQQATNVGTNSDFLDIMSGSTILPPNASFSE